MNQDKKYCVYIHTNKINNKKYVGQTSRVPEHRWNHGKGYVPCEHFYNAILKYGWQNFNHEIIATDLTLEEANILQQELIKKYQTTDEKFGYNILSGGLNYTRTEAQKQHQSQAMKKRWQDLQYQQKVSKGLKQKWKDSEYRTKVINSISGEKSHFYGSNKKGENNPMFGKHHSEETKAKISQAQRNFAKTHPDAKKGKNNPMARPVQCIQTGEKFDTCKEAALWSKTSTSSMNRNVKGQQQFAGTHPVYGFKVSFKYIKKE